MKVWILTNKEAFNLYSIKRFKEEAEKTSIDLNLVAPEYFEIIEPFDDPFKIIYKNKQEDLPDCLISRMGSGTSYFALAVIRFMQKQGVFILNSSASIENAKDKLQSIQILAANNIPIPKTMLAKFPINIRFVKKQFHFPLIMKTISGSQGKGVLLCENVSQLEDIASLTQTSSGGKLNIILQEFISTSRGKDIRVFVIGGRAIGAMLRTAKEGKFKANFSAGGEVSMIELTPELEWLAVESANLMGLDMAGVDILFDKGSYKVCEVNSSPGFKGFEKATKINIPQEVFSYVQVRLGIRN